MCEKRTKKVIKKGTRVNREREARRIQRLERLGSPTTSEDSTPPSVPHIDKIAQNRVILELAWKTMALMHKNRLIQQKIIDLQKETSEFVASVMSNPDNRRRYLEHMRLFGAKPKENPPLTPAVKLEPTV